MPNNFDNRRYPNSLPQNRPQQQRRNTAGTGPVGNSERRPGAQKAAPRPINRNMNTQGVPRHPARPQPPAPQKNAAKELDIAPNTKRNLFLAAVLLILVTLCIIVFAAQSCSKSQRTVDDGGARDSVKLNTPKADDTPESVPVLAQYTEQSKTLSIESGYGVLIDIDKNEIIASKNADKKIYPASMTKMMTLIVAMENIDDLEDTFTFTADIIDPLYTQNASVAGFAPGETVPLKDIIYGCILPSGADCTSALAIYVAGSEEEFAKMMNEKAAELGLENTHFVTASGLHDDDHYSTCIDMAAILEYAIKNEEMRKVLSTYRYTTTPTPQHPDGITVTSTLFSRMNGDEAGDVFVQGGKTGYTLEGKNCLATFAANCTESEAAVVRPQYILVTAYASGEYTPVHDAIDTYSKYCSSDR